jgi:hypothetical protein
MSWVWNDAGNGVTSAWAAALRASRVRALNRGRIMAMSPGKGWRALHLSMRRRGEMHIIDKPHPSTNAGRLRSDERRRSGAW